MTEIIQSLGTIPVNSFWKQIDTLITQKAESLFKHLPPHILVNVKIIPISPKQEDMEWNHLNLSIKDRKFLFYKVYLLVSQVGSH